MFASIVQYTFIICLILFYLFFLRKKVVAGILAYDLLQDAESERILKEYSVSIKQLKQSDEIKLVLIDLIFAGNIIFYLLTLTKLYMLQK